MSGSRATHPTWFKLRTARRDLLRSLPSDAAVNVLLGCLDYLETGTHPGNLTPLENVAFAAFLPDLEEAMKSYQQRVTARIVRNR